MERRHKLKNRSKKSEISAGATQWQPKSEGTSSSDGSESASTVSVEPKKVEARDPSAEKKLDRVSSGQPQGDQTTSGAKESAKDPSLDNSGSVDGRFDRNQYEINKSFAQYDNLWNDHHERIREEELNKNRIKSDDFISAFARKVQELSEKGGFSATGCPLKRYPPTYFEDSGLLKEFDKHLSSKTGKGCNATQSELTAILQNLRQRRKPVEFFAGCVTGVPGSGKSTLLKSLHRELYSQFDSAIVLGNEDLKSGLADIPRVFTAKEILLLKLPQACKVVLIDEYNRLSSGEVLQIQRILQARIVILFGDRAQGSSAFFGSVEWLNIPEIYFKRESHRFGKNTAALCGKQGLNFQGSGADDEVVEAEFEGSTPATEINLAFTRQTQQELEEWGISSVLVADSQGKEYDSATLFITEHDKKALSDPALRAVGFTRHRRLLVIRCEKQLFLLLISGELASNYQAKTNSYGA